MIANEPLVSVICLCHNQSAYVVSAIASVLNQTHPAVELIVVDDGSKDGSKEKIKKAIPAYVPFIDISFSIGNCSAFNQGLQIAKGEYIIDLAADDELLPQRIEEGLKTFYLKNIGIEFCNVAHFSSDDVLLKNEYPTNKKGESILHITEGDIYFQLIKRYFISPSGMMISKRVLDELNGYDETLDYEDFDFWIRSSRNNYYGYTDKILVKKRAIKNSLAHKQTEKKTKHQQTTFLVCGKIHLLNQDIKEANALTKRCFYEIRQCIRQSNWKFVFSFLKLALRSQLIRVK